MTLFITLSLVPLQRTWTRPFSENCDRKIWDNIIEPKYVDETRVTCSEGVITRKRPHIAIRMTFTRTRTFGHKINTAEL